MLKPLRLVSAVLAALMLVPLILSGGSTRAAEHPDRIDGVDYTRVNENRDALSSCLLAR